MKLKDLVQIFRKKFDVYTDGSHKGKWGSWAFVVVQNNKIIHEASGRVRKTNSHRMEFQAAIEALSYLKKSSKVRVHSDSKVLINSLTKPSGRSAVNADQIEKLNQLSSYHKISWTWVKAHSGVQFNERCDELCAQTRN